MTARAAAGATLGDQGIHLLPSIDPGRFQTPHDQQLAAVLLKAGIANPSAWSAAGLAMPQTSVKNASVADKSDPNRFPPVVLMRGSNEKSFVISWRSQQDIARSLGWKCAFMIFGGPALALVSLYVFLELHPF